MDKSAIVEQPRRRAELLSHYLLRVLFMGLAAYLGVFVLFALVPISSTRRLFGQLPAIAFWGGIPASVVLFVAAFFMNERKASVRTMLLAVFSGLLWFLAAFGSLAMLWGNN